MSLTARTIKQHGGKNEHITIRFDANYNGTSGGNKFTGSGLIKFTKNDYLIRSQLSLILALPLSHFACLMLKCMLSTLRWFLLVCLGIFFISCPFLGGVLTI